MQVVLLGAAAWPRIGGIENSLNYLASGVQRVGGEATIICFRSPPGLPSEEYHKGVRILRMTVGKHRWPGRRFQIEVEQAADFLNAAFDRIEPDYIWSRYHTIGLAAAKTKYCSRVSHIFPITATMASRDIALQDTNSYKDWLKKHFVYQLTKRAMLGVERELIRTVKSFVFSHLMQDQLNERYGVSARLIMPGVDSTKFAPLGLVQNKRFREEHGIPLNHKVVLFVGRITPYKNLGMLLQAMEKVAKPATLVVVGDGPQREDLQRRARALKCKTVFIGSVTDDLPRYYSFADVTVVPSVVESFGQVYLESFACGTPAIGFSSRLPQCSVATDQVLKDGNSGWVCNEFTADALARTIDKQLGLSFEAAERMGESVRGLAETTFSWDSTVRELLG